MLLAVLAFAAGDDDLMDEGRRPFQKGGKLAKCGRSHHGSVLGISGGTEDVPILFAECL